MNCSGGEINFLRLLEEPYQMLSRHLEFPLEFRKNFSPDSIKKCLIHVAIVISWNKSEIFDKT